MVKTRRASVASSREEQEDRMSRLPDQIIHYILSFVDMKFAVQTSILSKRWIDIWKTLPFLNFDWSSFSSENTKGFIDFVDMVFIFRDHNTDIQKFSVVWMNSGHGDTAIANVNRWGLLAVKQQVQEFIVFITQRCSPEAYRIPHQFLNCKSLRKLVLTVLFPFGCLDIILPRSISLPLLKVLNLTGLSISDAESSERLFSSCPVLEELEISDCNIQTDRQRNLSVGSLSLKEFSYMSNRRHSMPNIIKLCAPVLESFEFQSLWTQDYSLEVSSPLFKAAFYMDFDETDADKYMKLPSREKAVCAKRTIKFLGAVSMVKEMTLAHGFLEVLSQAPDLLDREPPQLRNLEFLGLNMWCTRGCLRAIAYLLKISPKIAQLELLSEESINFPDVGDDWEAGLSSPGMLSHLESVQIEEVNGCDAELKLLRFLLKNAKVLKKVALSFHSSTGSRIKQQFKRKLRAVPRASSSIDMVFN